MPTLIEDESGEGSVQENYNDDENSNSYYEEDASLGKRSSYDNEASDLDEDELNSYPVSYNSGKLTKRQKSMLSGVSRL